MIYGNQSAFGDPDSYTNHAMRTWNVCIYGASAEGRWDVWTAGTMLCAF